MKSINQLLVNLFSQFGASIVSALFTFVFMYFAARKLGVETFGQFSTVQIYVSSFFILTDMGISNTIVREIAEKKYKISELSSNLLLLKLFLGVLVFVFIPVGAYLLNYSFDTQRLIFIYGISIIPYSISNGCNAIFNGYEKLIYSSITILVTAIGMGICTILVIGQLNLSLVFFTMSLFSVFAFSLSFYFLSKKFVTFSYNYDERIWKSVIKKAWPFGAIFFINTINISMGPILLSILSGETQVGYYNLSNKIIAPFMLFIAAYNSAIFPFFSRLKASSSDSFSRIFPLSLKVSSVIGLSGATLIFVISENLIHFLFPGYDQSITILKIIALNIFFGLLSTATFNILYSDHKEKILTKIYLLSFLLCVLLNFLLIPQFGVLGLCISQVTITMFQFIFACFALYKKYPFNYLALFLRSFLGVIPMFTMGLYLSYRWDFLPLLVFMGISLLIAIYCSPAFDKEDKDLLFRKPMDYLLKRITVSE